MTAAPLAAPVRSTPLAGSAPLIATAPKLTKRQREAAHLLAPDAPCRPVLLRAALVGRARLPRAALEITAPDGSVMGHVGLANTSAAFDPTLRWWMVGGAEPGDLVAFVSEGRTHVLLPGGRLRPGPVVEPPWSPLACRLLGWHGATVAPADVPAHWHQVFESGRAGHDDPAFVAAARRFRFAAVVLPLLFFAVCFPYLFAIRPLVEAGVGGAALLVLPVVGGGAMAAWSWWCRAQVARAAEAVEPGAARWGKEIAYTQSYWLGLRKPPAPWTGPVPDAAR
jgi:hypothetical protein